MPYLNSYDFLGIYECLKINTQYNEYDDDVLDKNIPKNIREGIVFLGNNISFKEKLC